MFFGRPKILKSYKIRNLPVPRQYALDGVRINALCPGFISTPPSRAAFESEEAKAFVHGMVPMGRTGTEEEVADMVHFLCSDRASYCHGEVMTITGGAMCTL